MYCQNCGTELVENSNQCQNCGQGYAKEQGRGVMILIFGILSLVSLGPFLGIPAWVMGYNDLKKIKEGIIPVSEKGMTQAGMILGIISVVLTILLILAVAAILVIVFIVNQNEGTFS